MTFHFLGFNVSSLSSLTRHKLFVIPLIIFTSCTSTTLYTPAHSLSFSYHCLGAFLFCFSPHNFLVSLSFFTTIQCGIGMSLDHKSKNDDYFGVFFVVNQDYLNFSCNLKFSCSYSSIVCKQCPNHNHIVSSLHQSYN